MSNSTPPGWYPDPAPAPGDGGARERYWDGGAWTEQYRSAAVRPPVAVPPPQPVGSPPAGSPPDPVAAVAAAAGPAGPWEGTAHPAAPVAAPPAAPISARPAVAGPSIPASSLSDASPAYGHPAVPEPPEHGGYGFPPPGSLPMAPQPMVPQPTAGPMSPSASPAPMRPVSAPPPGPQPGYGFQGPPQGAFAPPRAPAPGYGSPYLAAPAGGPARPSSRRRPGLIVGILGGALALTVLATVFSISIVRGGFAARQVDGSAAVPPGSAGAPAPGRGPGAGPSLGARSPGAPSPGATGSDRPSALPSPSRSGGAPALPDGTGVVDAVHGWVVPVPGGWNPAAHDGASTLLLVTGPYDCATPGGCVRGNFSIDTAPVAGQDAATTARATMTTYAPQLFGELAAHQELDSGPLTAAGLTGYAVRWHVTAQQGGARGFLLLVALPAPGGGFTTLVGSVDDDPRAPLPGVLDQLVAAIRPSTPPNGV
ncbi:hypothetical protein GCM10009665_34010 [Kitasatospora nipponensis]|uniref:DUF2510 domain-containing protein n=1 Tax=Kitasatospora nipponensis TaxID=258049 RepID=A0ABN1WBD6_9ACTN